MAGPGAMWPSATIAVGLPEISCRRSISQQGPASAYLEKVAKLIPGEVVAAYIAILGIVASETDAHSRTITLWIVFVACLVATPIYLYFQAVANKPKWVHLFLSSVGFAVWAFAVSGNELVGPPIYTPQTGSIVLILFSLISGAIPLKY